MGAAYVTVALVTAAANLFSGTCAVLHFRPILPGMARAGVPTSWLTFPIGVLKLAGAAGLVAGLLTGSALGTAAAAGLVLFFACAVHTHLLAGDLSAQFGLAVGLLALAAATVALDPALSVG
ncbi:DoxX family protein [Dactylosporangium sp. NBC_01737]|uniref:DoxX family protein n=1 Tax=Dactylosporangium sp. NBC_01737 TaxID=2975959 RepID=UPI002E0FF742|nr:DoxX family protein [Dactylosporangium sp. NBC_01737]